MCNKQHFYTKIRSFLMKTLIKSCIISRKYKVSTGILTQTPPCLMSYKKCRTMSSSWLLETGLSQKLWLKPWLRTCPWVIIIWVMRRESNNNLRLELEIKKTRILTKTMFLQEIWRQVEKRSSRMSLWTLLEKIKCKMPSAQDKELQLIKIIKKVK